MNLEAAKICYTFSGTKYFMIIGKIEKNSFFSRKKPNPGAWGGDAVEEGCHVLHAGKHHLFNRSAI